MQAIEFTLTSWKFNFELSIISRCTAVTVKRKQAMRSIVLTQSPQSVNTT